MKTNFSRSFDSKDEEAKLVNLTDGIIAQIKEKSLNARQASLLLEMIKAEIQECTLS